MPLQPLVPAGRPGRALTAGPRRRRRVGVLPAVAAAGSVDGCRASPGRLRVRRLTPSPPVVLNRDVRTACRWVAAHHGRGRRPALASGRRRSRGVASGVPAAVQTGAGRRSRAPVVTATSRATRGARDVGLTRAPLARYLGARSSVGQAGTRPGRGRRRSATASSSRTPARRSPCVQPRGQSSVISSRSGKASIRSPAARARARTTGSRGVDDPAGARREREVSIRRGEVCRPAGDGVHVPDRPVGVGTSALTSVDLPTPLCPTSTLVRPRAARAAR